MEEDPVWCSTEYDLFRLIQDEERRNPADADCCDLNLIDFEHEIQSLFGADGELNSESNLIQSVDGCSRILNCQPEPRTTGVVVVEEFKTKSTNEGSLFFNSVRQLQSHLLKPKSTSQSERGTLSPFQDFNNQVRVSFLKGPKVTHDGSVSQSDSTIQSCIQEIGTDQFERSLPSPLTFSSDCQNKVKTPKLKKVKEKQSTLTKSVRNLNSRVPPQEEAKTIVLYDRNERSPPTKSVRITNIKPVAVNFQSQPAPVVSPISFAEVCKRKTLNSLGPKLSKHIQVESLAKIKSAEPNICFSDSSSPNQVFMTSTPKRSQAQELVTSSPKYSQAQESVNSTPKHSQVQESVTSTPKHSQAEDSVTSTPKQSQTQEPEESAIYADAEWRVSETFLRQESINPQITPSEIQLKSSSPVNSVECLAVKQSASEFPYLGKVESFEVVTSRKVRQRIKAELKRHPGPANLPIKPRNSSTERERKLSSDSLPDLRKVLHHSQAKSAFTRPGDPDRFDNFTDNWKFIKERKYKKMPPNKRKNDHHGMAGSSGGGGHGNALMHQTTRPLKCSVPTECLQNGKLIYVDEVGASETELVKVICNNDNCDQSGYMHKDCFDAWEQTIISYLKSCGRARSWSEKQRLQNLWTKRGYDLAYKACACKCTKGHIRKDLNWVQAIKTAPIAIPDAPAHPEHGNGAREVPEEAENPIEQAMQGLAIQGANQEPKKKKKSKTKEPRPTLAISAPIPHPNNNHARAIETAAKAIGNSSTSPNTSNGSYGSVDSGIAMMMQSRNRMNSVSSNGSNSSCSSAGSGTGSPPSPDAQFCSPMNISNSSNHFKFMRKNSKASEMLMDRTRRDSGGFFSKRMDYSSFNKLPRHKVNSYQIRMEDDAHGGNDDIRNMILQTLTNAKVFRVGCILCSASMPIFDRFPIIDGTFFLSPRQHARTSLEVAHPVDGSTQYMSAVCMGCLEGWFTTLRCRACFNRWDGSSLVIGSCYTYDIFAATPCCQPRLECLHCHTLVFAPVNRPKNFSDYSKKYCCQTCGLVEFHLAKPLPMVYDKITI